MTGSPSMPRCFAILLVLTAVVTGCASLPQNLDWAVCIVLVGQ